MSKSMYEKRNPVGAYKYDSDIADYAEGLRAGGHPEAAEKIATQYQRLRDDGREVLIIKGSTSSMIYDRKKKRESTSRSLAEENEGCGLVLALALLGGALLATVPTILIIA